MVDRNCKSCRHFLDTEMLGQCRRYPTYQNRHANEWCGEFTTKIDHVVQDDIGFVEKRKYVRKVQDVTTAA
jgi:hypothetical protein